jgi:hypothetical protein
MAATAGGNPAAAEAKNAFESLPSPLDSIEDMRSAAKWMLAAAGAVGATLISGGPLVAIGQVHGALNIFLAVLGLVFAVSGAGVAIWYTSNVLVPRLTTPATFRSAKELTDLRDDINREPEEFFGVAAPERAGAPDAPVDRLFKRQEELRQNAASLARQAAAEKDPARREQFRKQLRRVEENGERVGSYVRYVLALGHAWRIKAALQQARLATLAGAGLVIVGAALFFSSTASNGPAYVPVVTTTPAPAVSPTPTTPPTARP